ncbi:MAG: diaminopimelate epimerase [Saprospiraceae bacterium]|jgi:diaminopimelate epimerase
MLIPFYKYQGAGNDFVLIDQRDQQYLNRQSREEISFLCDRRFGIGADGLMLLQNIEGYDFEMIYFNADGRESTMCGNGGRCIVAFAQFLGIVSEKSRFLAIDGAHEARINPEGNRVELQMSDVRQIEIGPDFYVLNTGSPHYVTFVPQLEHFDVFNEGKKVRYNQRFSAEGINVNFVKSTEQGIEVATYERGVEDETLSCGTGVTASAISFWLKEGKSGKIEVPVITKGGELSVRLESDGYTGCKNIWLIGPAMQVFEGKIAL